jgi:hypothetical protein
MDGSSACPANKTPVLKPRFAAARNAGKKT